MVVPFNRKEYNKGAMDGKLPPDLENPIDAVLLQLTEPLLPLLYRTGHTPNLLTTYSFLFAILAAVNLWRERLLPFAVCYVAAYLFDCLDGQFARRYAMTSALGDVYDHTTDVIGYALLLTVLVVRRRHRVGHMHAAVFAALAVLMIAFFGCQQRWAAMRPTNGASREPETLDAAVPLCRDPDWIRWLRYFGSGTMQLFLLAYLLLVFRVKDKEQ
jgi:CDP-diacylglycerol--glycerol-3-phosphate 3-phosphatidyltransferase